MSGAQEVRDRAALPRGTAPVLLVLCCAALLLRRVSYESIAITALVGAAGLAAPAARSARPGVARWAAVTTLGAGAFLAARLAGPGLGIRLTGAGVASIIVAAVAEEMFFRRFLYGWLEPWGPVLAIGVTSLLFAVIHVPTYGAGALPVDGAAGALLGWQRWASGGWTAPAATHVLANLLQMG